MRASPIGRVLYGCLASCKGNPSGNRWRMTHKIAILKNEEAPMTCYPETQAEVEAGLLAQAQDGNDAEDYRLSWLRKLCL